MNFLAIFILGLQLGATACAISCLPIMTPILLSKGASKRISLQILFQYFGGKILAYCFISTFSFFGASVFKTILNPIYFSKIAGLFLILIGIQFLYRLFKKSDSCNSNCNKSLKYSYISVGFFSSFSFCLPVLTLIAVSSASSILIVSTLYGLVFGISVVLIPFLFLYFFIFKITNSVINELYKYKKTIELSCSILLICSGLLVYNGILKL